MSARILSIYVCDSWLVVGDWDAWSVTEAPQRPRMRPPATWRDWLEQSDGYADMRGRRTTERPLRFDR